jgi:type IV pilus assembly protein PilA
MACHLVGGWRQYGNVRTLAELEDSGFQINFISSTREVFMSIKPNSRARGQGMTEYIIIVALIAIAAIAVYQYFGNTVRNQTAGIAMELAGSDGSDAKTAAQTAATKAATEANTKRNLDNYTGNAKK